MRGLFLALAISVLTASNLYALQTTIAEAEGYACMGEDKSKRQTEQAAASDAMRKAAEHALTHIKSETRVKDFELERDIVSAYSNAKVRLIEEIQRSWYKDPSSGDCYRVKLRVEVVPEEKAMETVLKDGRVSDDPSAPLNVRLWTDKKKYGGGDKIKIYVRGNKPFYARVIYKDAGGQTLQLLPNPYRKDNYFMGGAIYELPAGDDRFELEVTPPFGEESVVLYASTSELGEVEIEAAGEVYRVTTKAEEVGAKTRGVRLSEKPGAEASSASEFFEERADIKTGR